MKYILMILTVAAFAASFPACGDGRSRASCRGHDRGKACNNRNSWHQCPPRNISSSDYMRRFRPGNYLSRDDQFWGLNGRGVVVGRPPIMQVSAINPYAVSPASTYNRSGGAAPIAQVGGNAPYVAANGGYSGNTAQRYTFIPASSQIENTFFPQISFKGFSIVVWGFLAAVAVIAAFFFYRHRRKFPLLYRTKRLTGREMKLLPQARQMSGNCFPFMK